MYCMCADAVSLGGLVVQLSGPASNDLSVDVTDRLCAYPRRSDECPALVHDIDCNVPEVCCSSSDQSAVDGKSFELNTYETVVDICLVDDTVDATDQVDSDDVLACVVVDVVNDVPSDDAVSDHECEPANEPGLELATDSTTSGTGLDGYHVLSPFGYDEAKAIDRSIAGANYLFKTLLSCALPIVLSTVCLCYMRPPVVGVGKVELSVYAPEQFNNLDHLLLHVNGADEPTRPLIEEIAIEPRANQVFLDEGVQPAHGHVLTLGPSPLQSGHC